MAFSLATSYAGESLLSGFNWNNGVDLSNGHVSYKSREDAQDMGLYSVDPQTGAVRLGVDHSNKYGLDEGRPSIRLESKTAFNHGLFIADFLHMPPSQCGVWPAFWTYGHPWPHGGEVDIIEGANMVYSNVMSGHTAENCFLDPADEGFYAGERRNLDCFVGETNTGCGFSPPSSNAFSSYGDGFNAANGGVYAMLWDSDYIRIWHFPRSSIPSDIRSKSPDPSNWGLPHALFGGKKCDVDSYYKNMNIVININFCGDYGTATWNQLPTCKSLANSCSEYVSNNPQAFKNVYWDVSYIDVYDILESVPLKPSERPSATGGKSNNTSEPTTTTTMTTYSTTTVTVPAKSGTDTSPIGTPTAGGAPSNPASIGDYTHLGCFGSSSKFQTFDLTDESSDMTLERCVKACDGITYAGVFEKKCYCAKDLDVDTRAVADQSSCDHVCPGAPSEFCGGLVDATNTTLRSFRMRGRDAEANYLLSVYADLTDNDTPPLPPPMAPTAVVVTYLTVFPTNRRTLMPHITTVRLEDCERCDVGPKKAYVPMSTQVIDCDGCGDHGADVATITVPVEPIPATRDAAHAVYTPDVYTPEQPKAAVESVESHHYEAPIVSIEGHREAAATPLTSPRPAAGNKTGSRPTQPVVVVAEAWRGWKEVKYSVAVSLVAVIVAGLM